MKRYLKLFAITLIFSIGIPYTFFIFSSILTQTWTYDVDSYINSIDISGNGEYIVVGTVNGKAYLFYKGESKPTQIYNINNDITKVAISDDGSFIIVGTYNKLFLFNKTSSNALREYIVSANGGFIFSFSNDGNYILTGSTYDPGSTFDKLYLFQIDNSTPLWELPIPVQYTAITSNGEYFIIGGSEGLSLFSIVDSNPLWTFSCHPTSISVSNSGDLIVIGDVSGNLYTFNKQPYPLWSYFTTYQPYHIGISSDGSYILTVSGSKIFLFNKESSIPIQIYKLRGFPISSVDISFNGEFIIAAMDLPEWEKANTLFYVFSKYHQIPIWSKSFDGFVNYVKISDEGNYIIIAENDDLYHKIYKVNIISPFSYLDTIEGLLYILFYSGLPCTIIFNLFFILYLVIKKIRQIKKLLHEEEKENRDFNERLNQSFKKWEKEEDKKI